MSLRDHVIKVNREINREIDTVFDAFFDGIEWAAPFIPWVLSLVIITCFVIVWNGL